MMVKTILPELDVLLVHLARGAVRYEPSIPIDACVGVQLCLFARRNSVVFFSASLSVLFSLSHWHGQARPISKQLLSDLNAETT